MNIIIVGCGRIGSTLVEELSGENHDISIIDEKADIVQKLAETHDVLGVIGNGASYSILLEAGVETADIIIAVTNSDELNLLCCLIAKKAGRCETVARVRNPVYYDEISFIKEEMGISVVLNPELSAAYEIARLLRFPSAMEVNKFSKGRIEMLKYRIPHNSKLDGMTLIDVSNQLNCEILISAVERKKELIIPNGSFQLREKDIILFVGRPNCAMEFFRKIGERKNQVHEAMIIGGSNIENLYKLMDGRAEALEFHIQKGSPVIGRPIKDLPLIDNLLICNIYRKGKPMIPNGQDHMEEDDLVVVVTTKKGLHDVKDILKRG